MSASERKMQLHTQKVEMAKEHSCILKILPKLQHSYLQDELKVKQSQKKETTLKNTYATLY